MAKTDPWLRLYTETIDDEKLDAAAEMAGCEYDTVFTTWAILMIYAKKSPIEGHLLIAKDVPMTYAQIAKKLRRPGQVELVKKIIDAFIAMDMVGWVSMRMCLIHWDERQFKSDSSTQRWQEHNRRQRGKSNAPPTLDQPPQTGQPTAIHPPIIPEKPELKIIYEVTGLVPDYMHEEIVIRNVQTVHNKYRLPWPDELKLYLTDVYSAWKQARTTDGKPYNPANWNWLEWAITGFKGNAGSNKPKTEELTADEEEQAAAMLGLRI